MITYKQFVIEGGNIKVKTEKGEVAAAPFAVTDKNRKSRQTDIKNALSDLHDSFHKETGEHLFGKNKKALNSHSLFAGSTKDLMDSKISHGEFAKHKPKTGDIDVQFPKEHAEKLEKHLTPGKKLGKYTVVGTKKHGNEISAVMKHENGEHHQFDFEKTHYEHEEPTKAEQFLHSSNWEDTKKGIKGVHHKILINAAGGTAHKFSITHGLRSRTDESDQGTGNPEHVSRKLFGPKADHSKIHSFGGVAELIKKHIPAHRHQEIYDKFKSDVQPKKDADHGPALEHLRNTLGVKDTIKEEAEEETHHTTVIPLVGFSPFSHMGHAKDLGGAMKKLPGTKHIGISAKSDVFSPEERANILKKQWNQKELKHHVVKSAGETVTNAYNSLPKKGKKVLHILVGSDRKEFANGLKNSLESGKIKEMGSNKYDEIHIHHPEDEDRTHGMSGTNMRKAAAEGDTQTFSKHVGPAFSAAEKRSLMKKTADAIKTGKLALKR